VPPEKVPGLWIQKMVGKTGGRYLIPETILQLKLLKPLDQFFLLQRAGYIFYSLIKAPELIPVQRK